MRIVRCTLVLIAVGLVPTCALGQSLPETALLPPGPAPEGDGLSSSGSGLLPPSTPWQPPMNGGIPAAGDLLSPAPADGLLPAPTDRTEDEAAKGAVGVAVGVDEEPAWYERGFML